MILEIGAAFRTCCATVCTTCLISFILVLGGPSDVHADEPDSGEPADKSGHWADYRLLAGTWEGRMDDRFGRGSAKRNYKFIFDDMFLVGWHTSVRQPQELSPDGDFHRELSIFSFDDERDSVVLRQFLIEGFVLQFVCESKRMRLTCVSEHVENGAEIRARLTIEFENRYKFSELFELASGGEELRPFTAITFMRMPSLRE